MEYEEQADQLEKEAEALSEHADDVGGRIEGVRRDWEGKMSDSSVPGAVPDGGIDEEPPSDSPSDEADSAEDAGQ